MINKIAPIQYLNLNHLILILLLPFCLTTDWLINKHFYFKQEYWGVFDNWVHGIIAVFVCIPLFKQFEFVSLIKIYLIASLLDLDHFIINSSFSLSQAISISVRPPSHSITFAMVLALLYYIISKNKKWAFIFFLAIASHVVRDAFGGGTLIFYPSSITKIPYWSYILVEYALLISSFVLKDRIKEKV